MTRQISMQLDADTEARIAALRERGYGTTTNIIRTAIKRMAEQEGHAITEVWTDGSEPAHDGSFAASAWGREDATGIPADAIPFGRGAWRRTVTYYPE